MGPNYSRPAVPAPPQFRAGESQPTEASLGAAKWFDVFQDEALRELIRESIAANYDIRIAAQRVLQAQRPGHRDKSPLFPQAGAAASSNGFGIDSPVQRTHGGGLGVSWEPDLFGKVRRATEAARADLACLEENRNGIMQTLVAQVAAAYFDLLEYDAELEYVRESIETRQQSVKLVTAREEGGVASTLEVDQAKTLVASAQARRPSREGAGADRKHDQLPDGQAPGTGQARQCASPISRSLPKSPRACLRACSNAGPTCAKPNSS